MLRWASRDDGPVALRDVSRAEELVHAAERLRRLGEEDESTHGAIQAMDHAEVHVARLVVLLLEPTLEGFAHRLIARLVALDDFAGALADAEEVVVFVDDGRLVHTGIWGGET